MFEETGMLFIYVETPLHAGTGQRLGAVDLPIQRERTTGYPIVQASSIKGPLRAEAYARDKEFQELFAEIRPRLEAEIPSDENDREKAVKEVEKRARREAAKQSGLESVFGPETDNASDHAGALSAGDARILLFPVRSLAGVSAWTTSVDALARFRREVQAMGLTVDWEVPSAQPVADTAWVSGSRLLVDGTVVLEEFSFSSDGDHEPEAKAIAEWLAKNVLPDGKEYDYWKSALPHKLCILPEDAFRDFLLYSTEVQTHIKLNPATKTVDKEAGALWTSESLPVDTLLYAPLMATQSRSSDAPRSAREIVEKVTQLNLIRTHLGGDETTGQGVVALRFVTGGGGSQ